MEMPTVEYERHEMILVSGHHTGAEEWHCPTCGRRMIMTWPPNYRKVVLAPGDENAQHSGSKGGLQLGPPAVEAVDTILSDDLRAALDDLDLDTLFAQGD